MNGAIAVAGLWLGFAAAALGGGDTLRRWCAKEGPVEWISVVVLGAAALAWSAALVLDRRAARRFQPWAAVMLGFCVVVLVEELDWGALLGVDGLAAALQEGVGHRNLHNFAGGHGYVIFGLVPAAAVMAGLVWPRRGGAGPSRIDAAALVVAAVPSVVSTWWWRSWAGELDEFAELALYVGVLAWGVGAVARAAQPAVSSNPTRQRTSLTSPDL